MARRRVVRGSARIEMGGTGWAWGLGGDNGWDRKLKKKGLRVVERLWKLHKGDVWL